MVRPAVRIGTPAAAGGDWEARPASEPIPAASAARHRQGHEAGALIALDAEQHSALSRTTAVGNGPAHVGGRLHRNTRHLDDHVAGLESTFLSHRARLDAGDDDAFLVDAADASGPGQR